MQPKREPKVHTYAKKKRRRISNPMHTVLSVCLTFVVAGAIGVVGYSIAKPVLELTSKEEPTLEAPSAETIIPVQTEAPIAETTASSETISAVTEPVSEKIQIAVRLPEASLENITVLESAITSAKQQHPEMTAAVIPMKVQGGALRYDSDIALAETCGAVQGTLHADEIARTVAENNCAAIAECSLLYDNLIPDADPQTGYLTTDGSRWLDNKKENGGKPWINPFREEAQQYLSDLICEMADAGFAEIWCTDVLFPAFRNSDLNYIGETVQNPNRGEALSALLNRLAEDVGDVPCLLETDAQQLLAGKDEAFRPELLSVSGVVVRLTNSEQAEKTCRMLAQSAPKLQLQLAYENEAILPKQPDIRTEQYPKQLYGFVVG